MMGRKLKVSDRSIQTSERIVNGLFGGLLGGLAMLAVLLPASLLRGEMPGALLARFSDSEVISPGLGLLRHLSVSVVYGILFGLLWGPLARRLPGRLSAALIGPLYGLMLFALAELILLPGTGSLLRGVPFAVFGAAHLVYGFVLGVFLGSANEQ